MPTAIRELRNLVESFGLRAVEIGSNVNGVSVGAACFEPFFEAAADLDVAVFVHALRAAGTERLIGPPILEPIVAFPGEIALAIAGLITGGILVRHPRLRVAFSHGGGGFALSLARMEHFWRELPRFRDLLSESPRTTAQRAFYDLAVFDASVIRMLIGSFGLGQLLIGSDYPFGAYERAPLELLRQAGLGEAALAAVAQTNALRYLGIGTLGEPP
jgi:aminocarboxymuconate-semialdehyde decarboxylase